MEFRKYMHIERLGTSEVEGIEDGMCHLFPKIDGTNGSVWNKPVAECFDSTGCLKICAGSRNRELSLDNDNAGFMKYVDENHNIQALLFTNPSLRLYGEWLVPHTLKTYSDDAWRKFYVFDVMDGERYLPYEEYKPLLDQFEIDYIPPICKVENPTYKRIINQLEKNGFLIKDGEGVGEGVVIKRYDFVNKYGRTTWAKVVSNEFKAKHSKNSTPKLTEKSMVEESIINEYVTQSLVDKEFSKIEEWSSKKIPQLLNTVYYCLIKEESWNFVKKFKNPKINFNTLQSICFSKVKELKPELF